MSTRFTDTAAAEEIMRDIEDGKYSKNVAYGLLNQIINDLPNTTVAREAQAYLDNHYWFLKKQQNTAMTRWPDY